MKDKRVILTPGKKFGLKVEISRGQYARKFRFEEPKWKFWELGVNFINLKSYLNYPVASCHVAD